MSKKIQIVEVGPRDGLQNESQIIDVSHRLELIKKLSLSGLKRIEIGAFVSPEWVPQMQGTMQLCQLALAQQQTGKLPKSAKFSVLVPNSRGMADALQVNIPEVAVFGACTETFSKKNINCSIEESLKRFREVIRLAKSKKIKVRGYLSVAFGCPYEGRVDEKVVVQLVRKMKALGVYEVSIGDTIGVATPRQVESLTKKLIRAVGVKFIAMHFHDTRGTALANVLTAYNLGVRVFDSSIGGLGGCPYAKGASGNLATEDLVYMFEGMQVSTGVNLKSLIELRPWIESQMGKKLPGRASAAGLPIAKTLK